MDQKTLLKIVQTWDIKNKPAFRGFKCGSCGKILHKAWHNWLNFKEFKTPVHLCNKCQQKQKISIPKTKVSRTKVDLPIDEKIAKEIINKWKVNASPICKIFICDLCGKNIYKAYHIWVNLDDVLSEIHFCRKCGYSITINKN